MNMSSWKLQDFFVSETLGFVLKEPLEVLPAYFDAWNGLARDMPHLVATNAMREKVLQMAVLDWSRLEGHRQKRLAHLQLTVIASGYVWMQGDRGVCKRLPPCVSVPLCAVAKDLGLPPVFCHASGDLANYAVLDPDKPLELGNLRVLYCLPGEEEAAWFILVTTMVELTFAKALKWIVPSLAALESKDSVGLASCLTHITPVIQEMKRVFSRMHEKLTADTFFNKLRPFLGGWGGENNPLPEGLVYEGVSDKPIHAIGASAAQSATLQVLDALLGVEHSAEQRDFLLTMRNYMLPAHQNFIGAVELQARNLQHFVKQSSCAELHRAFNNLLSAVVDFRSYHIQIVTKYIVQASVKSRQTNDKRFESLDNKGTGGTSILPFLKDLREDTKSCLTDEATNQGHR